jgi:hypothetical protein
LNKCQEEFEAAYQEDKILPEDPKEKTIFKEKQRQRKLEIMNFVGELFKIRWLSTLTIFDCVSKLLTAVLAPKEKDLVDKGLLELRCELLCKLMRSVGRIDHPFMDTCFDHLTKLRLDVTLSPRIRLQIWV